MTYFDVLVSSLRHTYRTHNEKWVRNIQARSLSEACRIACEKYPNLGITPTTAILAWSQYLQPKE